jgi:hypothetical protein
MTVLMNLPDLCKMLQMHLTAFVKQGLVLWKEKQGNFGTGCIQGAIKERPR